MLARNDCGHWSITRRLKESARRSTQVSDRDPSPINYNNFVHEQNNCGRQRDPCGQRVASEEVQSHACPAEASSD
jgi:hypothetical protein